MKKKEKHFYYDNLFRKDKEAFFKKAFEENLECLYKMLAFEVTESRMQSIIKKEITAKNKTEIRMQNIKRALNAIHKSENFELEMSEFSDLSKMLLKDLDKNQFNMTIIEGEKIIKSKEDIKKR